MLRGQAISSGFSELDNIGYPQVCKLNTGDGIAVALAAIAQIGLVIGITRADSFAQSLVDVLVINTGADVAGVPDTVLFGVRDIVFVYGQGADSGFVNQRRIHRRYDIVFVVSRIDGRNTGNDHHKRQTHGKNLLHGFHKVSRSFHNLME